MNILIRAFFVISQLKCSDSSNFKRQECLDLEMHVIRRPSRIPHMAWRCLRPLLCGKMWKWKSLSHVGLFMTQWTTIHRILQARILEWVKKRKKNTGVGSLSLLQGIFPTQGSNPGLPHCRWILYQLSHKEAPCGGRYFIQKGQAGTHRRICNVKQCLDKGN